MSEVLAVVNTGGRSEVREFARPEVLDDTALLRVTGAGVCGSDVAAYSSGTRRDYIMGHENSGVIEEIGPSLAQRWGVQEGDRILVEEYLPCLNCEWCHVGEYRLCYLTDHRQNPNAVRFGRTGINHPPSLWGGFAQFLYLPFNAVIHPIGPAIASHHAPLALPIANGVQWALFDGEVGPGATVAVVGPGQQGLGCLLASKWTGARVVIAGLSTDAPRLEAAKALGADLVVDVEREDLVEAVNSFTGGRGVDTVVLTTSGGMPNAVDLALSLLKRKRGIALLPGSGASEVLDLSMSAFASKYATLRVTRGHSYRAVTKALDIISAGTFDLDLIATDLVGLSDVDQALTRGAIDRSKIHTTVDPWR